MLFMFVDFVSEKWALLTRRILDYRLQGQLFISLAIVDCQVVHRVAEVGLVSGGGKRGRDSLHVGALVVHSGDFGA